MLEIIPGILAHSLEEYLLRLDLVSQSQSKWVHIDIMDGQFVPNISVMPHELVSLTNLLHGEAHLMTFRPERYFSDLAVGGISRVLLHREAFDSFEECAKVLKSAGDYFSEVGLVINPDTSVESLLELPIQVVQCMGVQPGASGQQFVTAAYDTIQEVAAQRLDCTLAVDGAVNEETILVLQRSGITRFIMSSQLFSEGDLDENISHFNRILQGGSL